MATSLLTPEELSTLAEAVMDGSIPVDTGFNTAARVKRYDLASEDSNLGVNVGSIDMINERFIRLFRPQLMDVLRTSPRINPTKVQIVKFGDYVKDLRAPLSVNVIRMNPLRGFTLMVMDPTIVFRSTPRWCSARWTVSLAALAAAWVTCRLGVCSRPPSRASST
ncbi:MAG: hypothetical protein NT035_03575 [Burkholderiales bacterium]|nr:hypothetical protein [Burkholderiales bacterium]